MTGAYHHGICTDCWARLKSTPRGVDYWHIPEPKDFGPGVETWAPRRCCACSRWTNTKIPFMSPTKGFDCKGSHGD